MSRRKEAISRRTPDATSLLSKPESQVSQVFCKGSSKDVLKAAGPGLAAEEGIPRPWPPEGQEGISRWIQPFRLERPGAGLDDAAHRAVVLPGVRADGGERGQDRQRGRRQEDSNGASRNLLLGSGEYQLCIEKILLKVERSTPFNLALLFAQLRIHSSKVSRLECFDNINEVSGFDKHPQRHSPRALYLYVRKRPCSVFVLL